MPRAKAEHKNWARSRQNDLVDVLKRGRHFGVSFTDHDTTAVVIPALPDGSLIMGEVYRALLDEVSVEFPQAFCPDPDGHLSVAHDISDIHTHVSATAHTYLGELLPAPGLLDLRVHLYMANIPEPSTGNMKPGGDMLSLKAMSIQEITEQIAKGGIRDAVTIACLTRYLSQSRHGNGMLPTRMVQIEILDRHGEVISTMKTNKPEWSFNAYREDNPLGPHDWRFREMVKSNSPTGDTLPVKSSLSMRETFCKTPSPAAPVYVSPTADTDQDIHKDDADAIQETDTVDVAPSSGESRYPLRDEETQPIEPQPALHFGDHTDDTPAAPAFLSRRSDMPVWTAPKDDDRADDGIESAPAAPEEQLVESRMAETPLPRTAVHPAHAQEQEPAVMFITRRPARDPEVEFIEPDAEPDDEPVSEPASGKRRLNLSFTPEIEPESADVDVDTRPHARVFAPEVTHNPAEPAHHVSEAAHQQTAEPEAVRQHEYEPAEIEMDTRPEVHSLRAEPRLSSHHQVAPNPAMQAPDGDHRRVPGERRNKDQVVSAASRQADLALTLSRFTGFIKKTIQREPEEQEPTQMSLPPHMLYGVDDLHDDLEPPEPVFKNYRSDQEDR